jgi:uncharacterized membrane protein YcaP (DUF421 family)
MDWRGLLIGETPWIFLIELLWRAALTYLLLLVFVRLMGKRVAAQLSTTELAVILMLGAAVALPMQVSTQGVLPAVVVLIAVLICHRGLSFWGFKSRRLEVTVHGDVTVLVEEGRLLLKALDVALLSREKLFTSLRVQGIEQLGQLRRAYLEASGALSIIKCWTPRPGLSILPDGSGTKNHAIADGYFACLNCAGIIQSDSRVCGLCHHCGDSRWREAVLESNH